VRKSEREIKDKAEVEGILARALVIHIAVADGEEPYVVPMNFGYGGGHIWLHTAAEGRLTDVLRRNSKVCFETYVDFEMVPGQNACGWSTKYRSVIGYGKAAFVTARDEKIRGLDCIMAKVAKGRFEYREEALARTSVIRIDIESMTGKKLGL